MRVAPRSVTRATTVSAMIASASRASDSTGHVQVMSPTVLNRTLSDSTRSPARGRRELGDRHEQSALAHDRTSVRVVEGRQSDALACDVLPHVELRPIADRKDAHVFTGLHACVVDVPQLRALVARVPLAERIAKREDAFFRARFFLVAARTADRRVEAEFRQRFEEASPIAPRCGSPSHPARAPFRGGWNPRRCAR